VGKAQAGSPFCAGEEPAWQAKTAKPPGWVGVGWASIGTSERGVPTILGNLFWGGKEDRISICTTACPLINEESVLLTARAQARHAAAPLQH
jgi:hypothetical protein